MKTMITMAALATLVGVGACKDKPAPVSDTNTTSAEVETHTTPMLGINDVPPADPNAASMDGGKPLAQQADPVKYVMGADGGIHRDGGMNFDQRGSSFESSGGTSGLGTPAHQDVPGQKIWSTK
ncbi:hypothetical protein BH09MYX1_BH09MYX1_68160 [soil metagenome]